MALKFRGSNRKVLPHRRTDQAGVSSGRQQAADDAGNHRARRFRGFAGATIKGNPRRLFSAATLRAARRMAVSTRAKKVAPSWVAARLREDLLDALIFFRVREGSTSSLPFSHEPGRMQTRIVQGGGVGEWQIKTEEVGQARSKAATQVRQRHIVARPCARVPARGGSNIGRSAARDRKDADGNQCHVPAVASPRRCERSEWTRSRNFDGRAPAPAIA
jgi:hypothetical protein